MQSILRNILTDLEDDNKDVKELILAILKEMTKCDGFGYDPCLKGLNLGSTDGSTKTWIYIENNILKNGSLEELKAARSTTES